MSSARRPISITLDAATSDRRVQVGTTLSLPDSTQQLDLYYGTQVLFMATILNGAVGTPFNPDGTCTWLFGIDDVPFSANPDYVVSLDAEFNITVPAKDWADLDEANGKISWRASLATNELKAALLLKSPNRNLMYANLWMLTSIGNVVWSWPVYVNKVHVDPTTATAVANVSHITADVFNSAMSELKEPTGGLMRLQNGALQLKNTTTGKFQTVWFEGAEGSEAIQHGPGED